MTWETDAGCHHPRVDPEIFHPTAGAGMTETAGLALHTCHVHCDVRAECEADAVASPPSVPQILGGIRWVSVTAYATRPEVRATPHTRAGCRICRGST